MLLLIQSLCVSVCIINEILNFHYICKCFYMMYYNNIYDILEFLNWRGNNTFFSQISVIQFGALYEKIYFTYLTSNDIIALHSNVL